MVTNEDDNPNEYPESPAQAHSLKIRRGMREAVARGAFIASRAPYGYRKITVDDDGQQRITLELDPPASEMVRMIFDLRLQGYTESNIVAELNGRGIDSPSGGTWTRRQVKRILSNEVYCGTSLWARRNPDTAVRVPNAFPPIVSQDEFDQAQGIG